jgi:hypothetical protein
MDTTWRVISLYVASILTVVIVNVGIAIALSFGLTEDSSLYDAFYTILKTYLISVCRHLLLNPAKDLPCAQSVPNIAIVTCHVCGTSSCHSATAASLSKSEISSDVEGMVISRP